MFRIGLSLKSLSCLCLHFRITPVCHSVPRNFHPLHSVSLKDKEKVDKDNVQC